MDRAMQWPTWWLKLWNRPYVRGVGLGLLPLVYAILPLPGPLELALAAYICVWFMGLIYALGDTPQTRSIGKGLLTAAVLSPILWIVWFFVWLTWFASDYDRFRVFY